ncbi:MAG: amino acid ABC transporter permease [Actinomycetota bacterium]
MSIRGAVPEDLERGRVAVGEEPVVEVAPERTPATPGEWIRRNLFSSWFNGVLTVLSAGFVVYVGFRLLRFVFVTGDWSVFKANLRVFMVGRFPLEELWRVWTVAYVLCVLAGLSRGALPPIPWTAGRFALSVLLGAAVGGALLYLLESGRVWALLGLALALYVGTSLAGRRLGRRVRTPLLVGWILAFPAIVLILSLGDVRAEQWGGMLLNLVVAIVAIFVSFPLGMLLALGRRSTLPALSAFCVGFIELVRGVPLVILLILGRFVLPLLLPPGWSPPQIIRAMIMITIFSAAYVAEVVRGGLQGIPSGQYEAARALGLSTSRMMALVILPQALRSTIPPMIGHFISVFKDTSLLAALGIFSDLLATARRASLAHEFIGHGAEALLPAAVIFWAIAFSMSRWSQRVERRVGVGER